MEKLAQVRIRLTDGTEFVGAGETIEAAAQELERAVAELEARWRLTQKGEAALEAMEAAEAQAEAEYDRTVNR